MQRVVCKVMSRGPSCDRQLCLIVSYIFLLTIEASRNLLITIATEVGQRIGGYVTRRYSLRANLTLSLIHI